ncbi:MAG: FecR family protein [Comamonadaceae bacterium]|nr:MAG: FecR family protein [Comamonadaceae bacterium]
MSVPGTPSCSDGAALDAATEAAIDWMVTLHSGSVQASERQAFEQWLRAHPAHRAAWQALHGPLAQMLAPLRATAQSAPASDTGRLLGDAMARAERRARQRRQLLRGALGIGAMAAGTALLAHRYVPVTHLSADLHTGTGERRPVTLPDGSTLTLDARSAVDLDFRPGHRTVTLRGGALVAQAAPIAQSQGGAPFIVRTAHGQVQALGTRFVVRQEGSQTLVGMLEHRVEITTPQGDRLRLEEGRSARFGPAGIAPANDPPQAASAWQGGLLEVHDQSLAYVVQALRAYRPGFIRLSPEAAALRVYGTYALDDTDRALALLAQTLPVQVRVYQRGWLVTIE